MVVGIFPMVGVAAFIVVLQTWATFQSPFSTIYNTFERPFVLSIRPSKGKATHFSRWYYLSPVTSLVLMTVTAVLEVVLAKALLKKSVSIGNASVLFQKRLTPAIPYMAEAALPLATFLVFGTQEDILEAWGIRKAPPETSLAMPDQSPVASTISSINC
ncbi:hypothetical protein B0F90DRAFT_1665041 [Multifurca ochricompacta]|uniref:Uncharacterized protein n=1 Tax=Multifurca ochricompacta TaxID=376703 RepID=A0AAD4MEX9_9AGAM|nr:hypothetical protein B0F90DRAFT_1665041 [Multifurca ochricompacta]